MAYTPHDKLSVADRSRRQAAQAQVGRFLRRFAVVHTGDESRTVDLIEKVFVDLAKRYQARPGGYTRIVKIGRRRGDNAPMVLIELVEESAAKAEAAKPAEPDKASAPKAEEPQAEAAPAAEPAPAAEAAPAAEPAAAPEAAAAPAAAAEEKKPAQAKKKAEDEAGAEPKPAKTAAKGKKKAEAAE